MPILPAQLRSALRFHLDGLRLHPHRRLVMAALAAGVVGLASISVFTIQTLLAAPAPPVPPKPLTVLPELPDAAERATDLKALTGMVFPSGWKLVAGATNARVDGPDSKSWVFMLAAAEGGAARLEEVKKLAPKPAALAAAGELAEALALELNRFTIGTASAGFTTPQWEAPGNAAARLDVLELDQVLIARVTWFAKR